MAYRNLTKKFIDIRNGAKANRHLATASDYGSDEYESGLLKLSPDSANWKATRQNLPPAWVENIELVEEDITKVQQKMSELKALHTKRLMVNFETDESIQEREIDFKTREVTEVFRHAESVLKRFAKQSEDPSITQAEKKVRKNMQMSFAKRLQSLSQAFRTSQKEYMLQVQSQKQQGSGNQAFDFLAEENKKKTVSGNYMAVDEDKGFNAMQLAALENTEELVNQRDEEIQKIAENIEELAQIFKELAVLVIDQGTILDRIDYNMETTVEHAKEGVKELQKAEEHQKNNLAVKCIILLVILIIIMIGVLIWKNENNN